MVNALVPGPAHNRFAKIDKPAEEIVVVEEIEHRESEDELMVNKAEIADHEPKPEAQVFRKSGGGDKSPTPTKSPTSGGDESNPKELKEEEEESDTKTKKKSI